MGVNELLGDSSRVSRKRCCPFSVASQLQIENDLLDSGVNELFRDSEELMVAYTLLVPLLIFPL